MDNIISIQDLGKRSKDDYIIKFDVENDSYPTKPLIHKNSRFIYILEGEGVIKIQNIDYKLEKGVVVSILPWQTSEIIEVTERLSYYLIVYNFNLLTFNIKNNLNIDNYSNKFIDLLYNNKSTVYNVNLIDKFKSLFDDVKHETGISSLNIKKSEDEYSTMLLVSKLSEILIYFIRNIDVTEQQQHKDDSFYKKSILTYMFLNSNSDISLKHLSKIFLMSESSISNTIRNLTGLKFYTLLNEMRLFKAEFLLLHTSYSLKNIAEIVNFTDSSYLCKLILEEYGFKSSELKNKILKSKNVTNYRLNKEAIDILNYIYENYNRNIDIKDITNHFNITPKKLNEILRYYIEKSFNELLNTVRIHTSYDMLLNTHNTIENISLSVGYNSVKTFNRNFARLNSMTPSEFRETYKYKHI